MGHWRKQMITFFVTSKCNLNCIYCYIPKIEEKIEIIDSVIDIDFAIAGLKHYFSYAKSPCIRFFSAGEATLELDVMKEIFREAQKLVGTDLKVELQSNGYFKEEVAEWIAENVDTLWISSDGPSEVQDLQRPTVDGAPSSGLVLKNIDQFSRTKGLQFGVRATIMPDNFHNQVELLQYFKSKGINNICGAPAYGSLVNKSVDKPILLDFAEGFVPAFYHAKREGQFYLTHLIVNFDEEVLSYCRTTNNPPSPQLTSDGYVSCCDWAAFGPKYFPGIMQSCIYGEWDKTRKEIVFYEENKNRIIDRNVQVLGKGECSGCDVLNNCAGGCIGKVMANSGDLHKTDPNWCIAVKYLAKRIPRNTGLYPFHHS